MRLLGILEELFIDIEEGNHAFIHEDYLKIDINSHMTGSLNFSLRDSWYTFFIQIGVSICPKIIVKEEIYKTNRNKYT